MTCKQFFTSCTLFCIATISTIAILFSLGLAFNDIAHRGEVEEALETVLSTPVNELRCLEVCNSWYSLDCGEQCCDRYNSNLCIEKGQCKTEYVQSQKMTLEILYNDTESQLAIGLLSVFILISLAFLKSGPQKPSISLSPELEQHINVIIQRALQASPLKQSSIPPTTIPQILENPEMCSELILPCFQPSSINKDTNQKEPQKDSLNEQNSTQ